MTLAQALVSAKLDLFSKQLYYTYLAGIINDWNSNLYPPWQKVNTK